MKYDVPQELTVEADGAVRILTMNNPDMLNAYTEPLHYAMTWIWPQLAADDECNAVLLTGAGRAFCAGGNIPGFIRDYEDPVWRRKNLRQALTLQENMAGFHKPVVAAVNGPAVGLGCSVAVSCDIVYIDEGTFMADPHVSIGLVAGDGGVVAWPLLMSLLKAKEYLFTGDRISAAECVQLGLANRVFSSEDLLPKSLELAQRLANTPVQSIQETKRAINIWMQEAIRKVAPFAISAESESFGTEDLRKTIESFKARSETKGS